MTLPVLNLKSQYFVLTLFEDLVVYRGIGSNRFISRLTYFYVDEGEY